MADLDFIVTIKTNLPDHKEQTFIAKPGQELKLKPELAKALTFISITVNSNPPAGSSNEQK
jgi:hypothetical protein